MMTPRILICIAVVTGLLCATSASAAPVVRLEPVTPSVNVGESVTVAILATFDEPVMAWGLDLAIGAPAYAAWTGTVIGANWDAPPATLDGDGLAGLRFPTGLAGEVLLATLTFEGLLAGETLLALSSGPEEDEGFLLASGGLATNVQYLPATLTVVPEPAAVALLGLAAVMRRRR